MGLTSLIVWVILAVEFTALWFIGFSFSLRTLRWFAGVTAVALAIAIARFGLTGSGNLIDAFVNGIDQVASVLLYPIWHGRLPVPGIALRWIVAAALLLGYRQLEASTLARQAPELDLSALDEEAAGGPGGMADAAARALAAAASVTTAAATGGAAADGWPTDEQRRQLAAELRFRLPSMEIRSPAILPGGSKTNALASIVESSGVSGAGMVGAAFRFASLIWPRPRRFRVRVRLESAAPRSGPRITVLLEDAKAGLAGPTKTVTGDTLEEASSMAAGYIARQVFAMDPTVPDWCYGLANGQDLGAMQMVRLARVYAACSQHVDESRKEQADILGRSTGNVRSAGFVRYELAQLLALRGQYLESLRLHAMNRELHPRFYRGRYRLAMSLEMITNPECYQPQEEPDNVVGTRHFRQTIEILRRCVPDEKATGRDHAGQRDVLTVIDQVTPSMRSSPDLARELLGIAARDLREVRGQLTAWKVRRNLIFRRDERAVWLPHRRRRYRQAFHDGVCVAELLVELRCRMLQCDSEDSSWRECSRTAEPSVPEPEKPGTPGKPEKRKLPRHQRRAIKMTTFIVGDGAVIKAVLAQPGGEPVSSRTARWWGEVPPTDPPADDPGPRRRVRWLPSRHRHRAQDRSYQPGQDRIRRLPWQRCTASWQAAYNTACLYAALADVAPASARNVLETWVIASLRRAMDNPESELERSSDWIDNDPDFNFMKMHRGYFPTFANFREDLRLQDYPAACPVGKCPVPPPPGAGSPNGHGARHLILSPVTDGAVPQQ
jgi:hypothetical protein